jgi:hypothetical protein
MSADEPTHIPLSVAVCGDEIRVLLPDGTDLVMTVRAAERTAQRLLDAVAIARGLHPEKLRA